MTNSITDLAVRKEIVGLLISSVELLDVFFFDQSKYLKTYLGGPRLRLEQDAKYFWIFHNLDYEKWVRCHGEVMILGLHGPSIEDLELAASRIVQSLRNPDIASQEGEVLYFFHNSTRLERGPQNVAGWRDLVCSWNLLRQLIENHSTAAGSLLQIFLERALYFLSDDELVKLRAHDDPTDVFRSLLCLSKPQNLWDALGQVLGNLKEQENPRKRNLTLVMDLNSMASAWAGLVDNIRKMTAGLPQGYGTVRILLSNLPEISNLWQHGPSEILLEYDKERKGMYSPQTQSSPIIVGFRFVPPSLGFCHWHRMTGLKARDTIISIDCPNPQNRMFEDPPIPQHPVREDIPASRIYISMALGASRVRELALYGGLEPFAH